MYLPFISSFDLNSKEPLQCHSRSSLLNVKHSFPTFPLNVHLCAQGSLARTVSFQQTLSLLVFSQPHLTLDTAGVPEAQVCAVQGWHLEMERGWVA